MPFLLGLSGLAVKWKSIGVHLGVPDGELNAIQQNNNANGHVDMCRDCLRDMFVWWLDNGDDVTAKKLARAFRKVNNHRAEVEIITKFCK